jgi:hypothetical protein
MALYLVRLVVVLRIKLEHIRLLLVVESANQIVSAELFPPLLTINEPKRQKRRMSAYGLHIGQSLMKWRGEAKSKLRALFAQFSAPFASEFSANAN